MSDFPDWTGSTQPPAPGTAAPWQSPNKAPLSYLVSAGSHANIIVPAAAGVSNYLFDLQVSLLTTGTATYISLEYGAFSSYTVFSYFLLLPNADPVVLEFEGVPLPQISGVGAGLYISSNVGAAQTVMGGVTYSVG